MHKRPRQQKSIPGQPGVRPADTFEPHDHPYDLQNDLLEQLLLSVDTADTSTTREAARERAKRERRTMREVLLAPEYERIAYLEAQVASLQAQLNDREALIQMLSPAISDAIAQRVLVARDEVAEALYPVIGKTIQRAVSEAMRDLARSIDYAMRQSLLPRFVRHLILRLRGIKPEEAAIRAAMPFQVREIFLIHRESGLLIQHLSAGGSSTDADLVGSMLTAIRSYVEDSFEPDHTTSLDAVEFGNLRIFIEEGQAALLAVVIQGVDPPGFRGTLRQHLFELHSTCGTLFREFNGDPIDAVHTLPLLQPLMEYADDSAQSVPGG